MTKKYGLRNLSTDTGLVLEEPVVVVPKPQGTSCTKGKKSKGKDKTANKDGFITPSETRNEPGSGSKWSESEDDGDVSDDEIFIPGNFQEIREQQLRDDIILAATQS